MSLTLERPAKAPAATERRPPEKGGRPGRARWVWGWAYSGVLSVVLALAVLVGYLADGIASGTVDWGALLGDSVWSPGNLAFGGLAMIYGSAVVCVLALVLAVPVGWAAAVALSEYLPPRLAKPLRLSIELLAAVPSIVYGLIGIMVIRPFVAGLGNVPGGDSILAAGIVLAVMIMPTIVAVSVDALAAVPGRYREAAYSLGLTRREVVRSAVLPRPGPACAPASCSDWPGHSAKPSRSSWSSAAPTDGSRSPSGTSSPPSYAPVRRSPPSWPAPSRCSRAPPARTSPPCADSASSCWPWSPPRPSGAPADPRPGRGTVPASREPPRGCAAPRTD
ncbi:ABC transporter permease subunit [Streptomyces roseicoloratus]|uniref:ABC transporter permease subunit n=1 Tax=Streptomyces roseicoloratus TaxID=2508722 RepID=A0ABY9RYA3_9ACTN|nr:ABC transporter permease subunit [Streptomyces roseicoloratus]WMX47000.1 ABC transporter permease subunit [Streptomyces roseicoloratus]